MKKVIAALLALALALCLAGCQRNTGLVADNSTVLSGAALEEYVANVKHQSDAIKAALEQEALTQTDMNQKSKELCVLWDAALTHLLEAAQKALPEAEMAKVIADQDAWLETKGKAVEAAGKEFEGGSIHALVVNSEAAKLTETRVYELLERLK